EVGTFDSILASMKNISETFSNRPKEIIYPDIGKELVGFVVNHGPKNEYPKQLRNEFRIDEKLVVKKNKVLYYILFKSLRLSGLTSKSLQETSQKINLILSDLTSPKSTQETSQEINLLEDIKYKNENYCVSRITIKQKS
ncbi:3977_t:CDS:2, partial [Funneliformis geosporum]